MELTPSVPFPGVRDRRRAASDERRHRPRRRDLRAIVLHQTAGPLFDASHRTPYPADPASDSDPSSDHRVDRISAHFVVMFDGTVFYTLDVDELSGSAAGGQGVDIEFAGTFTRSARLDPRAIRAGRALVRNLTRSFPSIDHIHPHGQVQSKVRVHGEWVACGPGTEYRCWKIDSCPGPDVWVNVGEWCASHLHLTTDPPVRGYQNNGISGAQTNSRFDQRIP